MSTTKVLISGCNGKMGQLVRELVEADPTLTFVGGYDCTGTDESNVTNKDDLFREFDNYKVDVIIDFSNPSALPAILSFANYKSIPIVIGTTGLEEKDWQIINTAAAFIPIFHAPNMSYGMAVLVKALKLIAPQLSDFEPEIMEKHHNRKADSPSGTAKMLANTIKEMSGGNMEIVVQRTEKRQPNEIGVIAKRGGNIVGYHEVEFISDMETITLSHDVHDRKAFALGAIKAAKFVMDKEPGLYGMEDLV